MNSTRVLVCLAAVLISVPAVANDQQKAQKELNKVTALARDFTGRTVVNLSMSQTLNVPRTTLVQERADTGLNYGSLFLASELVKSGATMPDIAAQLKAGKKVTDVANDRHADWKAIAEDAKKFNGTVDRNLYKYFISEKRSATPVAMKTAPAVADEYDVHHDGVKADADDASDKDIEDAQNRFLMLKKSAADAKGDNKTLGLGDERIGYSDHTQGPGAVGTGAGGSTNTNTGTTAPGFGGPQ